MQDLVSGNNFGSSWGHRSPRASPPTPEEHRRSPARRFNTGSASAAYTSPAYTWQNIVSDYGQSSEVRYDSTADLYSSLFGKGGDFGVGKMMSVPFLVVPVPMKTQGSQECPVSQNEIYTNSLEPGSKQTRATNPYRPGVQQPLTTPVQQYYQHPAELPYVALVESSQRLVELFQAQQPLAPELPPALIPDYGDAQSVAGVEATQHLLESTSGNSYQGPSAETAQSTNQQLRLQQRRRTSPPSPSPFSNPTVAPIALSSSPSEPPKPRFEHSLFMRGRLTVTRADYTEPYTVWWDSTSGAARVDFHGGATSTYRKFTSDGQVQGVEMKVDRTGETDVVRCAVTKPRRAQALDRALPAIPDLSLFSFAGYLNSESLDRVERWTHRVEGQPGQNGGARGEALVFRHELILTRSIDSHTVVPIRYSVAVDSSVLGPDCDGYFHTYSEVREGTIDPSILKLDVDGACDEVIPTEQIERVEPLREFTLPHRDPRYDEIHSQFVTRYVRQYADNTEWAVRKNLVMQASRFVAAGNRQGATFETELNFLGDRLDDEFESLYGVDTSDAPQHLLEEEDSAGRRQRQAVDGQRLPARFDWRELGGVTHVRFQGGSCASCWAFAVAGAVEGALFAKTGALVPLSEQCLVDCAKPYGGKGCKGTWPSSAYNYIQDRGLRALDEYIPYKEKVVTCMDKVVPPVTHIRGHVNVTRFSVRALKKAIKEHSPSVVLVDATCKSFIYYKTGVILDNRCFKKLAKLKHAVLAVGWDEQRKEPHFIVKNSWSDKWGDAGYARLHGPTNTCGVLTNPSYPELEQPDVDRQLSPTTANARAGAGASGST